MITVFAEAYPYKFTIAISELETVENLLNLIHEKLGIPYKDEYYVCGARTLQRKDQATLLERGLDNFSKVLVHVRMRGLEDCKGCEAQRNVARRKRLAKKRQGAKKVKRGAKSKN